ncbi:hypothetical protein BJ508DRAFT_320993 [Ascobolus immersus RN42]|uniref:Uncharacterized protein n=1 Tax=Ascobolus immersus RN42 TaxID=1160509 RepID=A0A3N4ILV1_ASCIM|nr:hypothetical protein BJ508DRAFT_320993 [Ascobolus immersus RN42]
MSRKSSSSPIFPDPKQHTEEEVSGSTPAPKADSSTQTDIFDILRATGYSKYESQFQTPANVSNLQSFIRRHFDLSAPSNPADYIHLKNDIPHLGAMYLVRCLEGMFIFWMVEDFKYGCRVVTGEELLVGIKEGSMEPEYLKTKAPWRLRGERYNPEGEDEWEKFEGP